MPKACDDGHVEDRVRRRRAERHVAGALAPAGPLRQVERRRRHLQRGRIEAHGAHFIRLVGVDEVTGDEVRIAAARDDDGVGGRSDPGGADADGTRLTVAHREQHALAVRQQHRVPMVEFSSSAIQDRCRRGRPACRGDDRQSRAHRAKDHAAIIGPVTAAEGVAAVAHFRRRAAVDADAHERGAPCERDLRAVRREEPQPASFRPRHLAPGARVQVEHVDAFHAFANEHGGHAASVRRDPGHAQCRIRPLRSRGEPQLCGERGRAVRGWSAAPQRGSRGAERETRESQEQGGTRRPHARRPRRQCRSGRHLERLVAEDDRHITRRLEPRIRRLLEAPSRQPHQPRREHGAVADPGRRIVLENGRQRLRHGAAPERIAAGEHFVEHRAEGEDVRPVIDRLAAHLFGRHVAGRTDHRAWSRGGRAVPNRRRVVGQACNAEVENLDATVAGHEHILGLEIPVHDAFVVDDGEAAGDSCRVLERLARRHRAGLHRLAQVATVQQLEHDVRARALDAGIVDGDDVRVAERSRRQHFLLKAPEPVGRIGNRLGEDLDRDIAMQASVGSAVHLAHAPGAEQALDLVPAEARARCEGHRRGL